MRFFLRDQLRKRSTEPKKPKKSLLSCSSKNLESSVATHASINEEKQFTFSRIKIEPELLPPLAVPHQRKSSLSHIRIQSLNIKRAQSRSVDDSFELDPTDLSKVHLTPPSSFAESFDINIPKTSKCRELHISKFYRRGSSVASQSISCHGPESPISAENSTDLRSMVHERSLSHYSEVSVPSLAHSLEVSDPQAFKQLERLRRKHNCVRELYSTECQFAQDMAVIVRIYMCGSAEVDLSVRQIGVLFSNVAQVLDVSLSTVAILESKIPEQILKGDGSISPSDLIADEDLCVGQAMCLTLTGQLYEVYEYYIHGSQNQMKLCYEIMKIVNQYSNSESTEWKTGPNLDINKAKLYAWLSRCGERVSKLTTAWSLESLLIKPIQRLGKYPLFLKSMLECTDSEHRDYADLQRAYNRSKHYMECVNRRFGDIEV